MKPIIEIDQLSKLYRLGATGASSLRELSEKLLRGFRSNGVHPPPKQASKPIAADRRGSEDGTFWALRDVSFNVEPGEVIGVIGRNGAGKSTLLKLLSRITEPTHGRAVLRGRVASLLEVGTGFHPELTGRENVLLNGAILGMRRSEIVAKFDEIVDFAEIGPFVDTPVKRYSSGMYMRLAFAVAAHLEAEILLIDEVLAVGDSAFQKKSLGKMEGMAKTGRTVLFVSHNMVAVEKFCPRSVLLLDGRCARIGPSREVIPHYLQATSAGGENGTFSPTQIRGDGRAELLGYTIVNPDSEPGSLPLTNDRVEVCLRLRINEPIQQPACAIAVWSRFGTLMTAVNTTEQGIELAPLACGDIELTVQLGPVTYLPGSYRMSFELINPQGHIYLIADEAIYLEIGQRPLYGTRELDHRWGCVFTPVSYRVTPCSEPIPATI